MKPVTFVKLEAVEATVVMRWEHFELHKGSLEYRRRNRRMRCLTER